MTAANIILKLDLKSSRSEAENVLCVLMSMGSDVGKLDAKRISPRDFNRIGPISAKLLEKDDDSQFL